MKKGQMTTFLIELPLRVDAGQTHHLCARLEGASCFYNAVLGETLTRLKQIHFYHRWQAARTIPRTQKQECATAFARLRCEYRFSEYDLHAYAKEARCTWIADHLDSTMAQTLAARAYHAYKVIPHQWKGMMLVRAKGRRQGRFAALSGLKKLPPPPGSSYPLLIIDSTGQPVFFLCEWYRLQKERDPGVGPLIPISIWYCPGLVSSYATVLLGMTRLTGC